MDCSTTDKVSFNNLLRKLFELFDVIVVDRLKTRYDLGKHPRVYNDLLDVMLDVKEEQRDEINQHDIHHLL